MPTECVFCDFWKNKTREILMETTRFFAVLDGFPVTEGHTLIIPKRHIADVFLCEPEEWEELFYILQTLKARYDRDGADGYNIGINCGETAGQTVFHLHVHLFPRRKGDVDKPRGGVRNFKQALVAYE